MVANLFESYLGAAVQGKALWLSNDIVNGIQITLAASLALVTTACLYTFHRCKLNLECARLATGQIILPLQLIKVNLVVQGAGI